MIDQFRSLNLVSKIFTVLLIILTVIAVGYFGYTQYKDNQLEQVANSIEVPADWELQSSEFSGNYSCLDSCRRITNEYLLGNTTIDELNLNLANLNLPGTAQKLACDENTATNIKNHLCGNVIIEKESNDYLMKVTRVGEMDLQLALSVINN